MYQPSLPIRLCLALCLLFPSANATAQVAEVATLTLREAVEKALQQNLGLRIQKLDPEIVEESVIGRQAAFDPTLFSQGSIAQSDLDFRNEAGEPRQTLSDNRSYRAGVAKKIATGATITASSSLSRTDGARFDPDLGQIVGSGLNERASFSLEITQPLLRDFGSKANLAPLRKAESRKRVADLQTRNAIFDLLQTTEIAYWRLADRYERHALSLSNLELAGKLLEEAQERERLGLATSLETLQAQANLAERNEEIIRAEQAIREAGDELLAAIGSLDESLSIDSQPRVSSLPIVEDQLQDFQSVLQTAFELNFDTDIQEEILQQLEQDRILAKNGQRPEVDLTLSSSYNGLSNIDASDAFSEALDRRGDDWGLALSFNLPWGNRSAKSNLRQTLHQIEQAELRLIEIKQDLLRSLRSAWRTRRSSQEQLRAAEIVVELQEATYEQERGEYDEGLSTLRDLLENRRDLDAAKLRLLTARLDLIEADIRLERSKGTLLQRAGLDWNDEPIQPTQSN